MTVAVVDAFASPTIKRDITEYTRRYDPSHPWAPNQYRQIVPPGIFNVPADDECDPQGWYGEQTLDIEAVHAMAPGANVLYVGGEDCNAGIDAALNHIVAGRLADIVSNSYGSTGEDIDPAEVRIFGAITLQGALEGIGLYFSSGDDGDESVNLDQPSADFEPTLPWVTGVGGTSLAIGRNGTTQFETGWETGYSELVDGAFDPGPPGDFFGGSGGGTSRRFAQPWYQRTVVPKSLSTRYSRQPARVVPDVAALGDPNTGFLVGQTQTFSDGTYFDVYRIGGTSVSSPLFAGMMALADQVAHHPHGFANPALYRAYRDRARSATSDPGRSGQSVGSASTTTRTPRTGSRRRSARSICRRSRSTPPWATTTSPASACRTAHPSSPPCGGRRTGTASWEAAAASQVAVVRSVRSGRAASQLSASALGSALAAVSSVRSSVSVRSTSASRSSSIPTAWRIFSLISTMSSTFSVRNCFEFSRP